MPTRAEIEGYYKNFADSVQLNDFRQINLRHEAIKEFCDQFVPPGAKVLEIGCGVGIISRHLALSASRVVSVDISESGIRIARMYAKLPANEFLVLDVTEESDRLVSYGKFDAVLLADVIEHIPSKRRPELFRVIELLLAPKGIVLLTYPSPEYQEYLREKRPEALQVVDETVELVDLLSETNLKPIYFRSRNIWICNQYVHLALIPKQPFSAKEVKKGFLNEWRSRLCNRCWRLRNRSLVKKIVSRDQILA